MIVAGIGAPIFMKLHTELRARLIGQWFHCQSHPSRRCMARVDCRFKVGAGGYDSRFNVHIGGVEAYIVVFVPYPIPHRAPELGY